MFDAELRLDFRSMLGLKVAILDIQTESVQRFQQLHPATSSCLLQQISGFELEIAIDQQVADLVGRRVQNQHATLF